MRKNLGTLIILLVIAGLTALLSDRFLIWQNLENIIRRSALFGIISIGAAFVIITGGIDLSIGSMVCLIGCLTPWLLVQHEVPAPIVLPGVLLIAAVLGCGHGLLITRFRIQPFLVTLCGLLFYRGVTRGLTGDQTQGFRNDFQGLRSLASGQIDIPGIDFALPVPCLILLFVGILAAVFLRTTIWGRYLFALGNNEQAARYSGVPTRKMLILAYTVCGALSGLGGLLFVLDVGSAQPADFGNFYELYAIAAAVLGGCRLRGGEGTIFGVLLGAAIMQVLRNSITLIDAIPDNVEYAVIGGVILLGIISDEVVRSWLRTRAKTKELKS